MNSTKQINTCLIILKLYESQHYLQKEISTNDK